MNVITGLSSQQLRRAADIRERIETLQNELNALLGGATVSTAAVSTGTGKRNMSAQGRARISAAAKARWAKYRTEAKTGAPEPKAQRTFTPEGRAKLAALAKARWAKAKRAGKSRL
jgi:hypothetical protein